MEKTTAFRSPVSLHGQEILRDLGDGLILRRAAPEDAVALADFDARIHKDDGAEQPNEYIRAWVMDLMTRPHPSFSPGDFTLVQDTRSGAIVSSMNLIDQTWAYAGIPFKVGRPELVGTREDYRNRGLVRAQFDVVHEWSRERGQAVQAITGIPYYYRLYGYEMALNLNGGRSGHRGTIPALKADETEPFCIRPAERGDLAFIRDLAATGARRGLVQVIRDEAMWQYELSGKSPLNANRFELRIVETCQGEPVAFFAHPNILWGKKILAVAYEVKPGVSWAEVTPVVARYLTRTGQALADKEGKTDEFKGFGFWGGAEHPAYRVFGHCLPEVVQPYAFYLRVSDLPGFLHTITPALEQRLAGSLLSGTSRDLKITFYRDGLHLVLEKGRLVCCEPYHPMPVGHAGDAAFPGLTFLQILFGYRSFQELHYAFPDCWAAPETAVLLDVLFPRQASDLWPVS